VAGARPLVFRVAPLAPSAILPFPQTSLENFRGIFHFKHELYGIAPSSEIAAIMAIISFVGF
jgi:hypothetical protein